MTTNKTATIVAFKFIPIMLEHDWQFVCLNTNPGAFRSTGDGSAVMVKPGNIPTRNSDGLEKKLRPKRGEENGDDTAPTVKNVTIPAGGDKVRIVMTEDVMVGPSCSRGFKLVTSTETLKLDFDQINGDTVICKPPRIILGSETGLTLNYTQPIGGIQDVAGNDLSSFENYAVTNNSAQ